MKTWQYVGLWLLFFIAARFLLVNPILNVLDRLLHTLTVLADVVGHQ